jgi:hypothetical protein
MAKELSVPASVAACLISALVGLALYLGAEPWVVVRAAATLLPVTGYIGFSIFTVLWAMKIGQIGLTQEMTFQAKFYFYHGMAVILTVVLSAAGSFVVLFATVVRGLLDHGAP